MSETAGKYRKKPVVVDAWCNTEDGPHRSRVPEWLSEAFRTRTVRPDGLRYHHGYYIDTLEGEMHASYGDWIIRGVKGELYPCRDDIFKMTYEEVEPDA